MGVRQRRVTIGAERLAAQQVQVQVRYLLARHAPAVEDQPVTGLRDAFAAGDVPCDDEQPADQRCVVVGDVVVRSGWACGG